MLSQKGVEYLFTPSLEKIIEKKVKIWSEEVKKLSLSLSQNLRLLMQPSLMVFQLSGLISLVLLISVVSWLAHRALLPWRMVFHQDLFQL